MKLFKWLPWLVTALLLAGAAPAMADGSVPNPNETVDVTPAPTDLAQALVGAGVSVSNVTYSGADTARGMFNFTDANVVGFSSGLVMSSGSAADVVGANRSDWTSTDHMAPGDADLTALAGYPTQDASVLEFDFVPAANQVVFNYVFASDEYPEWVNTPFNDVFSFFVNGTNCATVRQTAGDPASPFVPTAVNNINNSNPVQDPAPTPMRPDLFRANYYNPNGGPSATDLELDGITSVLTCQSPVNPGQPNHMKLAIADASDGVYDSAVFIQAGSIVSNENPVADLSMYPSTGDAPLQTQAIIEGEDPNGDPLTYSLDWGDGSDPATGSLADGTTTVNHTYTYGGQYIAKLTVSNGTLSGTSTEDVDVAGSPPPPPPPPADTTAPTLAPQFSVNPPFLVNASGVMASANATDSESGVASESCGPVDTTTAGAKTLTCTATDNAGNTATADLSYVVGYQLTNVSPAAGTSYRKTQKTASVSFKLRDANGLLSDAAAAALRPSITVSLDGGTGVVPSYQKIKDTFSASVSLTGAASGPHTLTIRVTVGGSDVTTTTIPIAVK